MRVDGYLYRSQAMMYCLCLMMFDAAAERDTLRVRKYNICFQSIAQNLLTGRAGEIGLKR